MIKVKILSLDEDDEPNSSVFFSKVDKPEVVALVSDIDIREIAVLLNPKGHVESSTRYLEQVLAEVPPL
jgi:hypothetical protein